MDQPASPATPLRKRPSPSALAYLTLCYVATLYLAWYGAWLVERGLEPRLPWLTSSGGQFAYWTLMKLLLWVMPALVLIRISGKNIREVIGIRRWRSIMVWGGGAGLLIGASDILQRYFTGLPLLKVELSWALLNVVVVAPAVEELTFRGAVLGNLVDRLGFPVANTLTAFLFVGTHLPGWYFQGRLAESLTKVAGGALTIFLLGWIFGYVNRRSGSTAAAMLAHALNNFFS